MTRKKSLFILGTLLSILLLGIYIYNASIIKRFNVSGGSMFEPHLRGAAQICAEPLLGRSFLFLSDSDISSLLDSCDPVIISESHKSNFPNALDIEISTMNPQVQILGDEKGECTIYESSTIFATLDNFRCLSYNSLPVIDGDNLPSDSFRLEYTILVSKLAEDRGIKISKITERGDSLFTWYKLTLENGKKVNLPQGENLEHKMDTLRASINGLETAKEEYETIDLRFDRVVYR